MTITATHITTRDFHLGVQEYDVDGQRLVLLRATSKATVSLGLDFSPEDALEVADALKKHAAALIAKSIREAA